MERYLFLILSWTCVSAFIDYENINRTEALTSCVVKLIEEWKSNNQNRPHLYLTAMNANNLDLATLHKLEYIQFISRTFRWGTNIVSNLDYLVMCEDYVELKLALAEASADTYWKPTARFIIVVQNIRDDEGSIGDLLQEYNIVDVIIITFQHMDYAIYMYDLTSSVACFGGGRLIFFSWCSKHSNKDRLPALVKKFGIHGCRFKFLSHNVWPYVNFDDSIQGFDQLVISLFENYTGAKIDLVQHPKHDKNGYAIANYRKTMLHRVANNEFEGAIGGFTIRSYLAYSGNLSYIYPFLADREMYVLPQANALRPWQAVLQRCLYLCIMAGVLSIFFCIAAILLAIFRLKEKNVARDIILVLGCILNKTNVKTINRRLSQKLIVICIFIFAFIMPYILQSYLYSVMTNPIQGYEPKTINELEGYKLNLQVTFDNKHSLKYERICGTNFNCLLYIKNCEDKLSYTIIQNIFYDFMTPMLADENCYIGVYRMPDPYAIIPQTIFLRRGSVLLGHLQNFMDIIISTGICQKYVIGLVDKYGLKCRYVKQNKHKPLELYDFYGAFVILIVGYCISTLIFICELCMTKKQK